MQREQAVYAFMYEMAGRAIPAGYDPISVEEAERLVREIRALPETPERSSVSRSATNVASKRGLLPFLSQAASRLTLAGGAAWLGYKLGNMFVEVQKPAQPASIPGFVEYVPCTGSICLAMTGYAHIPGPPEYEWRLEMSDWGTTHPKLDDWFARYETTRPGGLPDNNATQCRDDVNPGVPPGFVTDVQTVTSTCHNGSGQESIALTRTVYVGTTQSVFAVQKPPVPYTGQAVNGSAAYPTLPTQSTVETGVADDMNNDPNAAPLRAWLETQMDPQPAPIGAPPVTAPDCTSSNMSASACESAFRDAGFEGTITPEVASLNGASLTKPADTVIATDPAPSAGGVSPGIAVRVIVNPPDADLPIVAPDCTGLTYDPCVQFFRDGGFEGSASRTFETFESADLDKAAAEVTHQSAAPGERVRKGGEITVRTNPLEPDMPVRVPALPPAPGEHWVDYQERSTDAGLSVNWVDLPASDPRTAGFDSQSVVTTDPAPATRTLKRNVVMGYRNARDPCESGGGVDPGSSPTNDWYELGTFGDELLTGQPMVTDARTGERRVVRLYWGPGRVWGYRHIVKRHGWDLRDAFETDQTLVLDQFPGPDPQGRPFTREYKWRFVEEDGRMCERRVYVDFDHPIGQFRPFDIKTSFSREVR